MRNVANDLDSLSFVTSLDVAEKIFRGPICSYSWVNSNASNRCSFPVKKRVQKEWIDDGEVKSHCSA